VVVDFFHKCFSRWHLFSWLVISSDSPGVAHPLSLSPISSHLPGQSVRKGSLHMAAISSLSPSRLLLGEPLSPKMDVKTSTSPSLSDTTVNTPFPMKQTDFKGFSDLYRFFLSLNFFCYLCNLCVSIVCQRQDFYF
jgi:hypothetical protein